MTYAPTPNNPPTRPLAILGPGRRNYLEDDELVDFDDPDELDADEALSDEDDEDDEDDEADTHDNLVEQTPLALDLFDDPDAEDEVDEELPQEDDDLGF